MLCFVEIYALYIYNTIVVFFFICYNDSFLLIHSLLFTLFFNSFIFTYNVRFIHYMTGWLVPHRYLGNGIQVCAPSLLRPCLGLISCTIIARNTKPGVWIHLGMAVSCTKSRALQPTFSPLTYF